MPANRPATTQESFPFHDPDHASPLHDEMVCWLDKNIEDVLMVVYKLQTRPTRVRTFWEPAVTERPTMHRYGAGRIIGYADLLVTCNHTPGFPKEDWGRCCIVFEAKTKIESLGELFRQIHRYETGFVGDVGLRGAAFVVVCPDEKDAALLRGQRVDFFKYDPKNAFPIGGV